MLRTYSELIKLKTFEERFEYLKLDGVIGEQLFGHARYLNQEFYRSNIWRRTRREIILRDEACDLGITDKDFDDYEIHGLIYVHHMNPITIEDLINRSDKLLDPENLICTSRLTHDAITQGLPCPVFKPIIRTPNDTCPWRK